MSAPAPGTAPADPARCASTGWFGFATGTYGVRVRRSTAPCSSRWWRRPGGTTRSDSWRASRARGDRRLRWSSSSRPPPPLVELVETTTTAGRACRDHHRWSSLPRPPPPVVELVETTTTAGRACRDHHHRWSSLSRPPPPVVELVETTTTGGRACRDRRV